MKKYTRDISNSWLVRACLVTTALVSMSPVLAGQPKPMAAPVLAASVKSALPEGKKLLANLAPLPLESEKNVVRGEFKPALVSENVTASMAMADDKKTPKSGTKKDLAVMMKKTSGKDDVTYIFNQPMQLDYLINKKETKEATVGKVNKDGSIVLSF